MGGDIYTLLVNMYIHTTPVRGCMIKPCMRGAGIGMRHTCTVRGAGICMGYTSRSVSSVQSFAAEAEVWQMPMIVVAQ